jgi:hypothetical protein
VAVDIGSQVMCRLKQLLALPAGSVVARDRG